MEFLARTFVMILLILISVTACKRDKKKAPTAPSPLFAPPQPNIDNYLPWNNSTTNSEPPAKKDPDAMQFLREFLFDSGYKADLGQQCIRTICGPEERNPSIDELKEKLKTRTVYSQGSQLQQELDVLINRMTDTAIQAAKAKLALVPELVSNDDFQLDSNSIILSNNSYFINLWTHSVKPNVTSLADYAQTKVTKADIEKLKISDDDKSILFDLAEDETINKAFYILAYYGKIDDQERDLPMLLNDLHPDKSIPEALNIELTKCLKVYDGLHKFFKPNFVEIFRKESACSEYQTVPDSQIDMKRLSGAFMSAALLDLFFNEKITAITQRRKVDHKANLKKAFAEGKVEKWSNFFESNVKANPKYIEIVTKCHQNIASTLEVAPADSTAKVQLQLMAQKLIAETKKLVRFSDAKIQADFNKGLDEISLTFYPSREVIVNKIKDQIDDYVQLNMMMKEFYEQKDKTFLSGIYMTTDYESEDYLASISEDLENVCSVLNNNPLTDQIYTASGSIFLSWVTTMYPDYGVGIIAHEISHRVSKLLLQLGTKYHGSFYEKLPEKLDHWEYRACVSKFHSEGIEPDTSEFVKLLLFTGFTEEDWADYFASQLLLSIRDDIGNKNFACILMDEKSGSYVTSLNSIGKHSSGAFRAIHVEQKSKRNLAPVCQEYIEATDLKIPACFWD